MMASSICWRCLAGRTYSRPSLARLHALPLRLHTKTPPSSAAFTTAAHLSMPMPKQAKKGPTEPPKRGEKKTFKVVKKKPPEKKGKEPEPGERKAVRKRVVLSNTNALVVPNLQELKVESFIDTRLRGKVVALPGPIVDQLRIVQAFKPTQGWRMFRKPSMLIRQETLDYGKMLENLSTQPGKTIRRVLVGERGSGKTTMLLQAMTMAFMKEWVVINIPEAQDLTIAYTDYAPLQGVTPPLFIQKKYTATLLSAISRANPILADLTISARHDLPIPLQSNISLARLCLLGSSDPDLAYPIFQALLSELTTPSTSAHPRPPLIFCLDGLAHIMQHSKYISGNNYKPIHAHDLALIKAFIDFLSGATQLPNGGLVLAAASGSNRHPNPSLDLALSQYTTPFSSSTSNMLPSIEHNVLERSNLPPPPPQNPFYSYDNRVLDVFRNAGIQSQNLEGITKEEARGLMEYWATSGMLRAKVDEGLVGEKWTIAGGGVVGELERGCLRSMRL